MTDRPVNDEQSRVTRILPPGGWQGFAWRELLAHRELVYFLVWRDVKVRYRQTLLGAGWVILQPVLMVAVFSLFFGKLAGLPSDGVPYPAFVFAALVPWMFFAQALGRAAESVVANTDMIRKVYFPRMALPLAGVLVAMPDFLISFAVLSGYLAWQGSFPTAGVFLLPVLFVVEFAAALGLGLWLAAANMRYRDIRQVMPFLTQLLLFATPVVYPASMLPDSWRTVYGINPMAGVVEGFRHALLGTAGASWPMVALSAAVAFALLASGVLFFGRVEKSFADVA